MKKYKVVLDAFGGDNAPLEIVKGAVKAVNQRNDVIIVLVGKEDKIKELLAEENYNKHQIEIVNATDVIINNESPTMAIRRKKQSSLVVALDILKNDESVCGLVSAGSTGAVLTGGFLKIGRMKGVSRPALGPILPTVNGKQVMLIDCGANMDSKPINLCHFALMGSSYMKGVYGIEKPRVALLNVGVEDKKGNDLVKAAFPMLKELPINFVGNMEARDALSGDFDVIVADGFAGNILLKSTEGAIKAVTSILKPEIKKSFVSKMGYLLMKKPFKVLKDTLDHESYGGSPFLGCKKIIIKSHGSSHAHSIYMSIGQVLALAESNVYKKLEKDILKIAPKKEEGENNEQ